MTDYDLHDFDMQAVHHACSLDLRDVATAISAHNLIGARAHWARYVATLALARQAGGNTHTDHFTRCGPNEAALTRALATDSVDLAECALQAYEQDLLLPGPPLRAAA